MPTGKAVLTNHESEKDIRKAQQWLQNLGSSIKVTGRFTIGMMTALCKFQRDHKLTVTGVLDDDTWRELKHRNSWWRKLFRKK